MRIIDLLNKIANGEIKDGTHIKYIDFAYPEYPDEYLYTNGTIWKTDRNIPDEEMEVKSSILLNQNAEVEIIEEEKKIPEKIEEKEIEITMSIGEQVCANKINEIIDYLKSKGE